MTNFDAPRYKQVAADLRDRIRSGALGPGASLPSERALVDEFGASRPTIRQAIQLLRSEGVVHAEHGVGVFVTPPRTISRLARTRLAKEAREQNRGCFLGEAAAQGFTPSSTVCVRFEQADERTALILGVDPGTEVTVRDRVMRADGLPVMLAVSRLPRDITRGTVMEEVETGRGGLYSRIEDAGYVLAEYAEEVGARMPTSDERATLGLADGVPVIAVTRVARADRVVEVNDMVMSADRYRLVYAWPAD